MADTYVYAIVRAGHPLPAGAHGVGDPPTALRVVTAAEGDDVAAIAGDAPGDLRARRRDLAAHHEVLTALADGGPVLPLQFGVVVPQDQDVANHLAEHAAAYRDALARVEGRTELNVKARVDVDEVLADIVRADENLLALRERVRANASYEEQLRLGEAVAGAVDRYDDEVARRVTAALEPHAEDVRQGPRVEGHAANVSFLVGRDRVDEFRAAVAELQDALDAGVDLLVTGPLPVYSFVPEPAAA